MHFNEEQQWENKSTWKLKINSRNAKFYRELKDTFKELPTQVEFLMRGTENEKELSAQQ